MATSKSVQKLNIIDHGDSVMATVSGLVQGVAWGPAVDNGEWFVLLRWQAVARRVADKDAAIEALREPIDSSHDTD